MSHQARLALEDERRVDGIDRAVVIHVSVPLTKQRPKQPRAVLENERRID